MTLFTGSSTIAYVECYDADYNEWYDAFPMNLSRSALSACVIAGLANAREYSYFGKARDLGQGERNIWTRLAFVANASKEMIKVPSVTLPPFLPVAPSVFIHIYDALVNSMDSVIDPFSANFTVFSIRRHYSVRFR